MPVLRPALLILLLFAYCRAQDQLTFHSGVALVHVDADVRQDRQPIAGLTRDSFRVTDDGKPQSIVYFGQQEVPLDVILLFDARFEMRPAVQRIAAAAETALADLHPGDRAALMVFAAGRGNCRTDLVLDFTPDLPAAGRAIGAQVLRRQFRRQNNLCQIAAGVDTAAQLFTRQPPANRRRALVILTDDEGAGTKPAAARTALRSLWKADAVTLGVILHAAGRGFSIGPPHRGARYFATETGGDTADTPDAAEGLQEMLHRLRSLYSLYYALPPAKPAAEHKIRVQLTPDAAKLHPHAAIRARTGYLTPAP